MKAGTGVGSLRGCDATCRHRRGGGRVQDYPLQGDHGGGAVPSGRRKRRRGAHRHQPDVEDPRAIHHHRERRRRRRHGRQRARSRLPHPTAIPLLAAAMGSHVAAPVLTAEPQIRSGRRLRADRLHRPFPGGRDRAKGFSGKRPEGIRRSAAATGDAVKQAHGGIGASSHMACLLFTAEIGAKPALVAYRGSGPALNDLVGGTSISCASSRSAWRSRFWPARSRPSRSLLRNASKRCPNVPTAKEAGVNYEMSVWAGTVCAERRFARKSSPGFRGARPVARVRMSCASRLPSSVARYRPKDERNPAAFDRFVRSEIARWSPIIAAAGTGK